MEEDLLFMKMALKLGKKGLGRTSPNPPVGAVIVKKGEIVGKGYHKGPGKAHAEIEALRQAQEKARGATLYVTLEPCHHYGRTPPCTKAILKAGISRVVIGCKDPHPIAQGGGEFLSSRGLKVKWGVLEEECKYLCRFFLSHILRKRPWIISKIALSIDGKIATKTGDSKWITNKKARKIGHRLRKEVDAILVGRKTVEKDDPTLTCRLSLGKDPIRLILDTHLRLSPSKKIFSLDSKAPTILICGSNVSEKKEQEWLNREIKVWRLPLFKGRVSLLALLKQLYKEEILSVLVEGGATVQGSFFDLGLVDEIFFFYGPVIIGGQKAPSAILGQGAAFLKEALWLKKFNLKKIGEDFFLQGIITEF